MAQKQNQWLWLSVGRSSHYFHVSSEQCGCGCWWGCPTYFTIEDPYSHSLDTKYDNSQQKCLKLTKLMTQNMTKFWLMILQIVGWFLKFQFSYLAKIFWLDSRLIHAKCKSWKSKNLSISESLIFRQTCKTNKLCNYTRESCNFFFLFSFSVRICSRHG